MSDSEELTYTWMVENFKIYPLENGKCLYSPSFEAKQFQNTQWCLKLYPRGSESGFRDYVSCFLYRSKDEGPDSIEINFTMSINGIVGNFARRFLRNIGFGFKNFINRKSMKQLNVVIECHMWMSPSNAVAANANSLVPYSLKSHLKSSELWEETCLATNREIKEVLKSHQPYSHQSFARTRVSIERRIFTCKIKDYLYPGSKHRQHILVTLSSATLVFILLMSAKHNADLLEIEICLENKEKLDCLLICKIELFDSGRVIHDFAEKEYILNSSGDKKNWNFGHPFKLYDLKERNEASLRFILAFSDGRYFSDIQWTNEDNCIVLPIIPNAVSKDLHHLFTEKKFCDVTIRTKDKSFDVHKTVLCSRSPVFAAMFESGMKESDSNVINIDDLDSDIVNKMLHFMYSGTIDDLKVENATKLFTAADKYHITPLKDICGNTLKNNLTLENICCILSLAEAHQDDDLTKHAVTFFSYHKNDILETEQWKEIEENNMHLAFDVLKKVCMKLLP